MTGLRKFTTKDLNAVVDAAEKYSVGFDDLFYRLHSYGMGSVNEAYPPYNIVQESNIKWRIELALAGWAPEEVEVTTESNVLLIRSIAPKNKGEEEYVHRGISTRTFARGFNLSDDVEIGTVSFNNGLLVVELRKIIPEHQQLKVYEIQSSQLPESDSVPSSDTL
ncbi:Hsp20 heat shock protein [Synechococcus phage ACG-2014b]|jgi:molecular chaperone IbpA|uniref:Hsp20 heat shock protein n=7 Tax=Kyanoviridae TaxID=2946160 RepID=A0A0E3G7N8_9CAUD|nr:Hsp20 heat shock protein [Synechococcus phage ACG-2014c]YP_009008007.1 Hsp20 heat shock protein [Synechococcus phage S-MbCM100]YP_009140717.1 Hsp20 heat shock protein [Synechococcus phage ACG-2014b]YP_009779774.1 Hsp20 heat shock protein [Synechococcus phage ACG-2014b]YP_009779992.1 Hsp20 heat shock protein [Synechococcus phage ACG-2014b]AHB80785.1 Hsp20 heat shock protein [Synechococcus phage S-MbCM25]AIX14329.1 Hsp20 heat shock protein [Synechococcus phage ACG-2014a]AFD02773.1 Hsp20 hea